MIDRVNSNLIQGQNQVQNDRRNSGVERGSENRPENREGSKANTGEQVSLSSSGRQMQALEQRVNDAPSVDQSRVAELRDAIERGEYEVDAGKIADGLIRDSREL
jgi:negative regulator of flagellin synthesis FlgM